ncbi:hypothetical protein, partial [Micromonospora sp. WMMD736]|uniref:hypothetical protein n=1 Tax=Micromonospora sp. WMMD736 TaxID=3404112 RepID=UPI003B92CF27
IPTPGRTGSAPRPDQQPPPAADATTAIPVPRDQDAKDANAATEKLNTRDEQTKRRGGGVSAQDLLRREGRM